MVPLVYLIYLLNIYVKRKWLFLGLHAFKIHTNHDGVRATVIMLRSNMASSEIASEASLRNYIYRPSSQQ